MSENTKWGQPPQRKYAKGGKCSKCGNDRDRNGRYCKACHNAYMRIYYADVVQSENSLRNEVKTNDGESKHTTGSRPSEGVAEQGNIGLQTGDCKPDGIRSASDHRVADAGCGNRPGEGIGADRQARTVCIPDAIPRGGEG